LTYPFLNAIRVVNPFREIRAAKFPKQHGKPESVSKKSDFFKKSDF